MHLLQHSSADGPGGEVQLNQLAMVEADSESFLERTVFYQRLL